MNIHINPNLATDIVALLIKNNIPFSYTGSSNDGGMTLDNYYIEEPTKEQFYIIKELGVQYSDTPIFEPATDFTKEEITDICNTFKELFKRFDIMVGDNDNYNAPLKKKCREILQSIK